MRNQVNSTAAPGHESQAAQKPQGFRVRLRFCYHLRLKEAKGPKTATNGQQVFKVPADARWVVVPQDFGDGWFAILPLLDNEQASLETTSGLQVNLGRITPSPPNSASHVIDIPERYPAKLLRDAEQDHRQFSRVGHLQLVAPAQDDSKAPYSDAELRYCYTLHFGEADKAHESTVEQPVFDVPYSWHWVLVRKYLRDGSAHVYPTTSHEETDSGSTKPHHVLSYQ